MIPNTFTQLAGGTAARADVGSSYVPTERSAVAHDGDRGASVEVGDVASR